MELFNRLFRPRLQLPEVHPEHPSHEVITRRVGHDRSFTNYLEACIGLSSGIATSRVKHENQGNTVWGHLQVETGMYLHSYQIDKRLDAIPLFLKGVMLYLDCPPVRSYSVDEFESDDKHAVTLICRRSGTSNATVIKMHFTFLSGFEKQHMARVKTEVEKFLEAYITSESAFKVEQIVKDAREEIESETRHQREVQGGSDTELPEPIEERRITLNHTSQKELRELIRDAKHFL